MNIAYHCYELLSATPLGALAKSRTRSGALLRTRDREGRTGYADLHPWPELGDLPLAEQLVRLARGETTDLTRASLGFAALDADARAAERSLWDELSVPESHFLLDELDGHSGETLDTALADGFTHFKIKVGKNLDREKGRLLELAAYLEGVSTPTDARPRLRLDYNGTLSGSQFSDYFACLQELVPLLDFIEDPFPFEVAEWAARSTRSHISFALDRAAPGDESFPGVIIHKPARFGPHLPAGLVRPGQRVIVTSYLDHPLGQLGAAWVAAQLSQDTPDERHGLVSHRVYEKTRFSEKLGWSGPRLKLPCGHGFGFDDKLTNIDWKTLR